MTRMVRFGPHRQVARADQLARVRIHQHLDLGRNVKRPQERAPYEPLFGSCGDEQFQLAQAPGFEALLDRPRRSRS